MRFSKIVQNVTKTATDTFNKVERETRHYAQSSAREVKTSLEAIKTDFALFKTDFKAVRETRAAEISVTFPKSLEDRQATQEKALHELKQKKAMEAEQKLQYDKMAEIYLVVKMSIDAAIIKKDWHGVIAGAETVQALKSPKHTTELATFFVEAAMQSLKAEPKDLEKSQKLVEARLTLSESKESEKTTLLIDMLMDEIDNFIAQEELEDGTTFFQLVKDLRSLITA